MKNKFGNFWYWGLTVFIVLAAAIILFFTFFRWSSIIDFILNIFKIFSPFLYGLLIAYILSPMLNFLESRVFDKLGKKIFKRKKDKVKLFSRIMSISCSVLLFCLIIFGIFDFIVPELFKSLNIIIGNIPEYLSDGKDWLVSRLDNQTDLQDLILNNYDNISNYVMDYINNSVLPSMNTIIKNLSNGIIQIFSFLFNVGLGFIVAIYLLFGKEKFIAQAKKMMYAFIKPDKAMVILENVRYIHKIFGGFLYGKVIDSLIIGILCFIFMIITKMPYAILISVLVGVTNIIPYFGPFLGAVPSGLLILLVNPGKAITFTIFIFILQQFDGNVLGPKILGNKTGLKSFWVLFAILIFGNLFGFIGMLFGVPLFAIIYAFVKGVCNKRLESNELPYKTEEYMKIDYIDPETKKIVYYNKEGGVSGVRRNQKKIEDEGQLFE